MSKKPQTDELTEISVPTKKINLKVSETEKIEIILRPFKQRHFGSAIAIINKYFDQFNAVRQRLLAEHQEIIRKYREKSLKIQSESDENADQILLAISETLSEELEQFDLRFNEGTEIAKAILKSGGEIGEEVKTIINMSIYKATKITNIEDSSERSPIDPDLDDLTWGECLVLLGSTVGLNMDFFAQNSKAMNLVQVMQSEPSQKDTPKDGEKLSVA
jgi:hypothetical protein